MKKVMFCRHCHAIGVPLLNDGKNTQEIQNYACRACNTLRAKKYRATKKGKANIFRACYKSAKNHKLEVNARFAVFKAKAEGRIKKPKKCSKCGLTKKIEAHHWNYHQPLDVIWCCRDCHWNLHRLLVK